MATTKIDLTRQATNSGDVGLNSHKITNVQDPSSAQDAATKAYVDSVAAGLSIKDSVEAATTGAETFTIASGSVTQISGTSVDGVSPNVGDRILIKDAPAASGAGSAGSDEPGNGIYTVTSNTTNLSVSRATDMSGSNSPLGAFTFVDKGTANGSMGYVVSDPNTSGSFTYGTNNIKWTKFTASGAGSVTSVSVVSANGFAGSVANPSTTPAITIQTSVTGLLKGNGTAVSAAVSGTDYAPATSGSAILKGNGSGGFSAATAGTDYMAPADFVTRETPTGSINGSNTTFTLANTPLTGTEEVYLNGVLQEPGAGNDYTISGGTITYLTAPQSGDRLRVSYRK